MKKILRVFSVVALFAVFALSACKNNNDTPSVDYFRDGQLEFTKDSFKITALGENDRIYVEADNKIILISTQDVDNDEDAPEYSLEGTFDGQIINKTKGSVLNLNGVTLTNTDNPAIYGEKKIELSAKKGTTNTITVNKNETAEKYGAVHCEKAIEIGGSGNLTITGNIYHGVKGGDVEVKGSGNFTVQGTEEGSAINCKTFKVKDDSKAFTLTLQNSKNGIKADDKIEIYRGTFNLKALKTALKTDKNAEGETKNHSITLGVVSGTHKGNLVFNCDTVTTFTDSDEKNIADYVQGIPE